MFDFNKITETLSSLAGGNEATDAAQQGAALQDIVEAAGLDPALLQGLAPQEIIGLLAQHGIDPAQFSPDQIGELAQSVGLPQSLTDLAASWLGGNRS